ncbi:trehalose-phosphatase [Arenimonas composti]|uniref:Trehalose 6-phosphate phosphatase n=1 Tax=Arenimonas composti TR7-09 = DSM 18010 TaxID=1121013 RepID=A0A091BBY9_9GAMM|nr:trehalose-phosphatase [Arenimonas composti]KFN50183.1 hypothetical protein P873_08060 [Arenimonas composti TR7-09 = DSM 18010]
MSALPPPPLPAAPSLALFLDIDGTLVEFADRPDGVRVPKPAITALAHLQRRLGGALAVLSGRELAAADRLLAPLQLPAGALHGLQRRAVDGTLTTTAPPPLVAGRVDAACRAGAAALDGVFVEAKAGIGFALHYRGAPAQAEAVRALAAEIAATADGHYLVQHGDCVAELKPVGQDKGSALAALMQTSPFRGRVPMMIGDDLTDEPAFVAARELGGHAVIVGGRRPTVATHALASPTAVRAWLAAMATARGSGVPA